MTGAPVEDGVILTEGGKIAECGSGLAIPKGAEVLELPDCCATPGLIDALSYIGLEFEPRGMREQSDLDECSEPLTPEARVLDGFCPGDAAVAVARAAGFTSCFVSPGPKNVVGGVGCAFKMKPGSDAEKLAIPGTEQMCFSLGEIPIRYYGGKKRAPASRMALAGLLGEFLKKASEYARAAAPAYDAKLEAMRPLFSGAMAARVFACREDDLRAAMRFFDPYGIRYSFCVATEAYRLADELARRQIPCIFERTDAYPFRQEQRNFRSDTPAALCRAGCREVCCASNETDEIMFLRASAGHQTALGMSREQALASLTSVPARLMGAQDRIGAIAPGMDADLAFFTGDPLSNLSLCAGTMIDGVFYDERRNPL